jgi:hypothetical protein
MQWVGDHVEVIKADETACVAMAETQVDVQEGRMGCLTRRDLTDYDYVSISNDRFVLISVKPTTSSSWLTSDVL